MQALLLFYATFVRCSGTFIFLFFCFSLSDIFLLLNIFEHTRHSAAEKACIIVHNICSHFLACWHKQTLNSMESRKEESRHMVGEEVELEPFDFNSMAELQDGLQMETWQNARWQRKQRR